ncbi:MULTISPECIES: carbamoyltransferase family protein [unclassified Streptomyces]|uniref:carbamoyltransferase family protein n=1 Tax=unclassified Streptomyces TaxID=2593676 RepID=UPI002E2A2CBF|nr:MULTISPECIES: carbamoyltransferase C-terminal domain-containing protein [unclassified Streptomyces]
MIIVGISALYHDSACALMVDGELVAAHHEERYTRQRNDPSMPVNAFRRCLEQAGVGIDRIDRLAYYENPTAKLSRQLWTTFPDTGRTPDGALFRLDADRPLREMRELLGHQGPVDFVSHHEAHAASAFYCSGFEESALLVADAVGEWATTSYGRAGIDEGLELLEEVRFPDSLGLMYSAVTNYLGFEVNSDEYKVMGLAPYGKTRFLEQMESLLLDGEGGQFRLDPRYFDFSDERRMFTDALAELLGVPARAPRDELASVHEDIAASLQAALENVLLRKVRHLHELTGSRRLCYAGGVALNCVANGVLRTKGPFEEVFVQPAAGDAGGAVGAAALVHHRHTGTFTRRRLRDARLGHAEDPDRILELVRRAGIPAADHTGDLDGLLRATADELAAGAVVGWFQGRTEFGPRALGGRSILADPRDGGMRDRINALVKKREAFRPFAPAVVAERCHEFFELDVDSPFMLETAQVRGDGLPAVTHVDGSARIQTVAADVDPRFHGLLTAFGELSGFPILLNTSFNMRGEPIVNAAADAIACFVRSRLDVLVLGDLLIRREQVPVSAVKRLEQTSPYKAPTVSESVYTFF